MRTWWKYILDLFLPPRCKKCGKIICDDDALCDDCFNELNFISAPYCQRCGIPFEDVGGKPPHNWLCAECARDKHPWFRLCRSALHYDEFGKALIIALKFYDRTDDARILAKWMKPAGKDIWAQGVDVIVPVPLHYTRLIKRKYNQAALLAKELSAMTSIPVEYSALIRHRRTRPQVEFSGSIRRRNVRGAFKVKHPEKFRGKRVLLIDDVMTTGSTLKECAKAINSAHPLSIDVLTAARVCR